MDVTDVTDDDDDDTTDLKVSHNSWPLLNLIYDSQWRISASYQQEDSRSLPANSILNLCRMDELLLSRQDSSAQLKSTQENSKQQFITMCCVILLLHSFQTTSDMKAVLKGAED